MSLEPEEQQEQQQRQYSDEEISKILATAKATRIERDEAAKKAKGLETQINDLTAQIEQIKGLDPERYQQLEKLAQTYEEQKLEKEKNFAELKERWQGEKTALQQQIEELNSNLKNTRIINSLEKAFYATGGRAGKDDDGLTYFDLIRDRAMQFIEVDDSGKLLIIDPRDKTKLTTEKGIPFTVEDLMLRFRKSGPTTALFEPVGNGAGGGMQRNNGFNSAVTREQLMKLPRAERLAKAREMGL